MSAETIVGGVLIGVVVAVLGALAVAEAKGWLPVLNDRLIDRAAKRLPEGARERYAEEWKALLAGYADRPVTALVQAISLYLKAGSVAAELAPVPQAVKSSGRGADVPGKRVGARFLASVSVLGRFLRSGAERWRSLRSLTDLGARLREIGRLAVPLGTVASALADIAQATRAIWAGFARSLSQALAILVETLQELNASLQGLPRTALKLTVAVLAVLLLQGEALL